MTVATPVCVGAAGEGATVGDCVDVDGDAVGDCVDVVDGDAVGDRVDVVDGDAVGVCVDGTTTGLPAGARQIFQPAFLTVEASLVHVMTSPDFMATPAGAVGEVMLPE